MRNLEDSFKFWCRSWKENNRSCIASAKTLKMQGDFEGTWDACWDWKKGRFGWNIILGCRIWIRLARKKINLSLSRKIGYGKLTWLHNIHCNVGLSCILPLATLILILMEDSLKINKNMSSSFTGEFVGKKVLLYPLVLSVNTPMELGLSSLLYN